MRRDRPGVRGLAIGSRTTRHHGKGPVQFVWLADPQIAPDGSRVAFVRVAVNEKRDLYETAIWLARTDGREPPRALTSGTRDSAPRWSPDGGRLAFVRSVEK